MQRSIQSDGSTTLELQPDVRRLPSFVIARDPASSRRGGSFDPVISRPVLRRFYHARPVSGPGDGAGLFQSQGPVLRIRKSILRIRRTHSAWFFLRKRLEQRHPRIQSSSINIRDSIGGLGDEQLRLVLDLRPGSSTYQHCHASFDK